MGLVAHTNDDVFGWIVKWMLYVLIGILILLCVCNIVYCCFKRKKHKENAQANTAVNIQLGTTHETHQRIVSCDVNFECERVLTEIKQSKDTEFVVKGGTHGRDVVTMDDGQGHATKSGVLRVHPAPATSTGCITSNDSDSDDSYDLVVSHLMSVKEKQKQTHRRDDLTQLTSEGE
eukprot:78152_1